MGCILEKAESNINEEKISKGIDETIRKDKKAIKLLLLGAGDTGKSTIFRQLQVLKSGQIPDEDLLYYKFVVLKNMLSCSQNLITITRGMGIALPPELEEHQANILKFGDANNVYKLSNDIEKLWACPLLQQNFFAHKLSYNDNAEYFMNNIKRICTENYTPTEVDIIRSRAKTSAVIEFDFAEQGVNYRIIDVGGQRSERRKWLHCFENVTALIFVASLADYDQVLQESAEVNRMEESLKLFKEMCDIQWFKNSHIILLLNKKDLFEEKIKTVNPKDFCFPNYTGGLNEEEASKYFTDQFFLQNTNPDRMLYHKKNVCFG